MNRTLHNYSDSNGIAGFLDRLANAQAPVVVDFTASYCAPCKTLKPLLSTLAEEHGGAVEVWVVDIESQREIAQHFGVRSVPTLLAFRDGAVCEQQVGFSGPRRVRELFAQIRS